MHRNLLTDDARTAPTSRRAPRCGTISIVGVFALLLLTMVLGLVINVGRQVDGKVKMQNAADAGTYSGGVVLARGMNSLAFTNHLLCDVFALTAYLREARDRNAERMTPEILAAWKKAGGALSRSEFEKFARLGRGIEYKAPQEQEMIRTFGEWTAASAELVLPVLEEILAQEMIPRFQRGVAAATPDIAQTATGEIVRRHGLKGSPRDVARGTMGGVLWRTSVVPVGGDGEAVRRTLPVVDPTGESTDDSAGDLRRYFEIAVAQREAIADRYLRDWNKVSLKAFDQEGKMSQFANLWRGFTAGQLDNLLHREYPRTNLPHVVRLPPEGDAEQNAYLHQDFMFLGVAYWPHLNPTMPGLFPNPLACDAQAYGQGMLFVPRAYGPGNDEGFGWYRHRRAWEHWWQKADRDGRGVWDLFNQSWSFQLVPATSEALVDVLQQSPPTVVGGSLSPAVRPAPLGGMRPYEAARINTH